MSENGNGFWKTRSRGYGSLQWATRQEYLRKFVECGDFQRDEVVLDVGTGTGLVAHAVAPFVRQVIDVDTSRDMLQHAIETQQDNEEFIVNDVRRIQYPDGYFDEVTARMVFHHILEGTQQAMRECYRVLAPGGRMIFSEGVPPHESVRNWYETMTYCWI